MLTAFIEHVLKFWQRILPRRPQQLFKNRGDVVLFSLEQAVDNIIDHFGVKAADGTDIFVGVDILWRDCI